MKKLFLLSFFIILSSIYAAKSDIFSLVENQNILYDSKQPLNEFLIYTSDKKCFIHYLSPFLIEDELFIHINKKSDLTKTNCLEKGYASVSIFNKRKEELQNLEGYFLDGFFIGNLPLNTYVMKRSADKNQTQYLYYFIDEDKELGIRYIGKMNSQEKNGSYPAFDACTPFEILLQTQNKDLFKEQDTIQNLFTVAKSYAQNICSQVQTIIFSATESPSLSADGVFFREYLNKDNTSGLWFPDLNQSFNYILSPLNEKIINEKERKSFLSEKSQNTTNNYVIHVSKKTNGKALYIDKPYLMKSEQTQITQNMKSGWYQVEATLEPMSDLEKKRSGISLNEKAAMIGIQNVKACKTENCLHDK